MYIRPQLLIYFLKAIHRNDAEKKYYKRILRFIGEKAFGFFPFYFSIFVKCFIVNMNYAIMESCKL